MSRGRNPVELSVHWFLTHPLGIRDHRQDPLGMNGRDTPVYLPALAGSDATTAEASGLRKPKSLVVSPSAARLAALAANDREKAVR